MAREAITLGPTSCELPPSLLGGNSLILDLAEHVEGTEAFITWNTKHSAGKTSLIVKTPEEYLTSTRTSS